ncbi:hypothetical protein D3C75_1126790 [compost metagenome]
MVFSPCASLYTTVSALLSVVASPLLAAPTLAPWLTDLFCSDAEFDFAPQAVRATANTAIIMI